MGLTDLLTNREELLEEVIAVRTWGGNDDIIMKLNILQKKERNWIILFHAT